MGSLSTPSLSLEVQLKPHVTALLFINSHKGQMVRLLLLLLSQLATEPSWLSVPGSPFSVTAFPLRRSPHPHWAVKYTPAFPTVTALPSQPKGQAGAEVPKALPGGRLVASFPRHPSPPEVSAQLNLPRSKLQPRWRVSTKLAAAGWGGGKGGVTHWPLGHSQNLTNVFHQSS